MVMDLGKGQPTERPWGHRNSPVQCRGPDPPGTLDFPAVVSKKKRRRTLARAGVARQQARRAAREARRRRLRIVVTAVVVLVALIGLALWIAGHRDTSNTVGAVDDYDGVSRHDIPNAIAEVTR